ncbi:MAG: sugar phosphate isomerase/epimerase [Phycisphaerales bacterium]|nr:sugar phosphate isomerase/epimerase [Phycisphaerales bacterium]
MASLGIAGTALLMRPQSLLASQVATAAKRANPISLAQWSLHRTFGLCTPESRPAIVLDAMDFAKISKAQYGITRVEYVNQFYQDRVGDSTLAAELRKRADDVGVTSVLIMCDGEGESGAADANARTEFAQNHKKWCALAQALGCTAIRVNARGEGNAQEQLERCADGITQLLAVAKPFGLNVIIENHGGLSSDGAWVAKLMLAVRDDACGTLPDFGNWRDEAGVLHDPVANTALVMPFAKGCSAKSYDFDAQGNETTLDYPKLLDIVRASKYAGPVGIEFEGKKMSESDGIHATKALLLRLGCVL